MAEIETITAHYSLTQSLSGFCNVRPSLSATAVLEEGEDPHQAMDDLMAQLKQKVQDLVDQALEEDGQPPRYFGGPRYRVIGTPVAYLVWPHDQHRPEDFPDDKWWRMPIADRRLEVCRELAAGLGPRKRVFECPEGELPDELLAFIEKEKARREQEQVERQAQPRTVDDDDCGDDYEDEGW